MSPARFVIKLFIVLSLAGGALLLGLFLWGVVEAAGLEVTRIEFRHPDVPPAFDGFSVAFLSDFHFGPFFSLDRTGAVIETANGLAPDLVLLGGDYADVPAGEAEGFFRLLGGLRAPAGVFAVLGNGDWRGEENIIRRSLSRYGVAVLDNRGLWLERPGGRLSRNSRIRLGGVRELGTWQYDLAPVLAGTTAADFVMLLVHQPDFVEIEKDDRLDLVLAGHTHGGQVNLFGWSPFVPSSYGTRFRAGLVRVRRTSLVVTRGLGTVILPVRLGSPPEIVLLTLRSGPPNSP